MKNSRAYQISMENNIPHYLRQYSSVIVQSPTGSGKSHMINKTVQRIIAANKVPLVISDSDKIHRQLLHECSGIKIDSTVKHMDIIYNHCYVAMAQSLKNRDRIIRQFHELEDEMIMIIDECHRNTATPIAYDINPCYLIGFSATPHWKWAKHLPELYNSLIAGPQIQELINDGFLAHYKHVIRTGADLNELKMAGQDFSEESQERVFGTKKMYDGIFEDLPVYHKNKTVIYVASIKQCEDMYQKLLERGYKVCRYHSKLDNATYELSKFTDLNLCDICVSVSSLTMGWDYPPIDLVIFWRATTSLPLYLQIGGRGSRPFPGKDHFTILDYGGNYDRFGPWNMDRDWQSLWQDPNTKKKISTYAGVSGSKTCPTCKALLTLTAPSCYNCGHIFPEQEMRLIQGQLLEVENTMKSLKHRLAGDLNPVELAQFAKLHDQRMYAVRVARSKNQDTPGFLAQFAREMGYSPKWVDRMLDRQPETKLDFYNKIIR